MTVHAISLEGTETPYTLKENEQGQVTLLFHDQFQTIEGRIVKFSDLRTGLDFVGHFLNGLATLSEAFDWTCSQPLARTLELLDITYSAAAAA